MNSQSLHAVVWLIIGLGGIAAGFGSMGLFEAGPNFDALRTTFWIATAMVAALLWFEARHDLHAVCVFGVIAGLLTAMICGSVAYFGTEPHPIAILVSGLSGIAALTCAGYLVWAQLSPGYPDLLREAFGASQIREVYGGVQFVATQNAVCVQPGGEYEIEVAVQNCWDTPRTLQFRLRPHRLMRQREGLGFDPKAAITLGGGEAGLLSIPVVAACDAQGKYHLVLDPRVLGQGGKRVRRRQAPMVARPLPGPIRAMALLAGQWTSGGGYIFDVFVEGSPARAEVMEPAPKASAEISWRPGQTVV